MPSATLLTQSLLSGVLIGGLYALLGLGVSLSWRFLRVLNLAHFAFVFLAAYLTYQFIGVTKWHPALVVMLLIPAFFVIGLALQWIFTRFAVTEFGSVLVTFGVMVIFEALIQWIWTADFRKLETHYATASWQVGPIFVPVVETLMFVIAVTLSYATWAWLKFTYVGKALRASADNPSIAAAFGVDHRKLAYLLSGVSAATGAIAGIFIAVVSTLAPSQIQVWLGVVFAVVIMGGLGNPLGVLAASLIIGISEALTMALIAPTWAPLVSFTLLILILIFRPDRL